MRPVSKHLAARSSRWLLPVLLSASLYARAADVPLARIYDGTMRPDEEVGVLSRTETVFPVRVVKRGATVATLPKRNAAFPAIRFENEGHSYDLYDYLAINRVAGLLILKDGAIAYEDYELGTGPATHWASFSMAKSITSTLTGAAIADGFISSLDDPVDRYVSVLRGGGYEGVTIRQILMMSSGVRWNETYTDAASDRRKVLELQLHGKRGDVIRYMGALPRAATPGTVWNYNTGETFVLGAVVEAATHRPLTTYLSEKIWSQAGMEQDATWWVENQDGQTWAGSGIGATLRDYGRFGLIAANGGKVGGKQIVPANWFGEAGKPHSLGGKTVDYGYMWWIPPQTDPIHVGAFNADGIFGQYLYVNPAEHLVIVVLSARSKPETQLQLDDDTFFAAVARALHAGKS
jgi:CubicO group peptidase (beta-lactamase class C family)